MANQLIFIHKDVEEDRFQEIIEEEPQEPAPRAPTSTQPQKPAPRAPTSTRASKSLEKLSKREIIAEKSQAIVGPSAKKFGTELNDSILKKESVLTHSTLPIADTLPIAENNALQDIKLIAEYQDSLESAANSYQAHRATATKNLNITLWMMYRYVSINLI